MKTMTEKECIDFVKSGFIPTDNNDVSDLQDCFNHQSIDFFVGLILDDETRYNAEKLMRACLLDDDMVNYIIKKADDVKKIIETRNKYEMDIYFYEQSINRMKDYISETNNVYERYIKK